MVTVVVAVVTVVVAVVAVMVAMVCSMAMLSRILALKTALRIRDEFITNLIPAHPVGGHCNQLVHQLRNETDQGWGEAETEFQGFHFPSVSVG